MLVNAEAPVWVRQLEISADHGQFYIYSSLPALEDEFDSPFLNALADAHGTRRFIGADGSGGLIDVMTPSQWNWNVPMRVELWDAEPPTDADGWDHEVDVDFVVDAGFPQVWFEASGGYAAAGAVEIPPGEYRVRISGSGYDASWAAHIETRTGHESFRMQLWLRERASPAVLRKSWPGFDHRGDWADYRL